ncbi:GDP-mannose 4,6-dehydratase [Candidatus Kaiserbacteria bacterium]|nr:GDP-mannose 4,6-dehydratase [Candidatus Kaiserbacteria bacterium]
MNQQSSRKDTVLVTGVAGFVGSNLALALLEAGYRVVGIDNFDDTYDPAFKEAQIAPALGNPDFELMRLDIREKAALAAALRRAHPRFVVHLAAKADTRLAVADPHTYVDNNITGSINLFETIRDVGDVENTLYVSSSSVYGNDPDIPWRESAAADRPLSPYGATKRAVELFAHAYHHNFGMNITCLRYFNVYGENNRPNMVPYKWTKALLTGGVIELSGAGTRKRDYTYVGDTIRGTILAMTKPFGYEVINLGNNRPLSLTELLAVLEKVTGVKANVEARESSKASVEETYADISKAKELLGWEPVTPVEEGMARLVEWFKANRL